MTEEFTRFLALFDSMVRYSHRWIALMDEQKLDWAPIENPSMRFGSRLSRITVRGLLIHCALAERNFVARILESAPGATVPLPNDPVAAARFENTDLQQTALTLHEENMAALKSYRAEDLTKKLQFVGREWTGMGLLWGMYAHRSFHLGNIDIYLRQSDVVAPEFFEFDSLVLG